MQGGHHLHTCIISHPRGFPMVKTLLTLNTQWQSKVHNEWYGCIIKTYEAKAKNEPY